MVDHEVGIGLFAHESEESCGIVFGRFVVVGRSELSALQSCLADVLGEFDDHAVIGVLDAGEHRCISLCGFNGGGHYLLSLFYVHGGMLTACATDEERSVARVYASVNHHADVRL